LRRSIIWNRRTNPICNHAVLDGGASMDEPDAPRYEIRATMADGSRLTIGPFATVAATSDQANRLLGPPGTRRVELLRRDGDRVALLGVVGWPAPAPRRDA
jgi:hypothetical protein